MHTSRVNPLLALSVCLIIGACGDNRVVRRDGAVSDGAPDGSRADQRVSDGRVGEDRGPSADGEAPDAPAVDARLDAGEIDGGPGLDASADSSPTADAGPELCNLLVATINGRPIEEVTQIDSTLDKQPAKPGFQVDVGVRVIGAASGKAVVLQVTGVTPNAPANSVLGVASFAGVSVNSNFSLVEFQATAQGCASATAQRPVQPDPSCQVVAPANGARLTAANDKIPNNGKFEIDVVVRANNRSIGGIVRLELSGRDLGTKSVPTGAEVTFENVVMGPTPSATFTATLTLGGLKATCSSTVSVTIPGPACAITSLVAPPKTPVTTPQGPGLGANEDADGNPANGLQTTIGVTTDGTATSVTLRDGSTTLAVATPASGTALFDVTLADGPHALSATCSAGGSTSNQSDAKVLVDVTRPAAVSDLLCYVKCLDTSCVRGDPALSDNRRGLVTCTFTSADGTGSPIDRYVLRYRMDTSIDGSTWDAPDAVERALKPLTGVSLQNHVVGGFNIPHRYAFALRAIDTLGNASDISNLPAPAVLDLRKSELTGEAPNSRFGTQIVVGDFVCDGLTDVAVGESTAGDSRQGRVRIFRGTPDGLEQTPAVTISGTVAGGFFGVSLSALDFNGDGCNDLAVRASGQDSGRGRAYLYLGRTVMPASRSDVEPGSGADVFYALELNDESASEDLAYAIGAADLDGDGRDDLAMTHADADGTLFSKVLIDFGDQEVVPISGTQTPANRLMPGSAELRVEGGTSSAWFGYVLQRGGLLDRGSDAHEELLIGAQRHQVEGVTVGALYVLKGEPRAALGPVIDAATSPKVVRIVGDAATEGNVAFGSQLAGLGDLDGNGIAEFAVADYSRSEGGNANAGKVYIFNLDAPLPTTSLGAKATLVNDFPASATNFFGRRIANGADVDPRRGADINNDLLPDVLVGLFSTGSLAQGSVQVFLGQLGNLPNRSATNADTSLVPPAGEVTTGYSAALTFLGDVNGDGFVDMVVGDFGFSALTGRVVLFN